MVTVSGGALTVIVSALVAAALLLSFTWTVKAALFTAVFGVPVIAPLAVLNDKPAGSDPEVTDHTYPPVPPLAVTDCE